MKKDASGNAMDVRVVAEYTLFPSGPTLSAIEGFGRWLIFRARLGHPVRSSEFPGYRAWVAREGFKPFEETLWWRAMSYIAGPTAVVRGERGLERVRVVPWPASPTDDPDQVSEGSLELLKREAR